MSHAEWQLELVPSGTKVGRVGKSARYQVTLRTAAAPHVPQPANLLQVPTLPDPAAGADAIRAWADQLGAALGRSPAWTLAGPALRAALMDGHVWLTVYPHRDEPRAWPWEAVAPGQLGPGLGLERRDGRHIVLVHRAPGSESGLAGTPGPPQRVLFAWTDAGGSVSVASQLECVRAALPAATVTVLEDATAGSVGEELRAATARGEPYDTLHLYAHGARTAGLKSEEGAQARNTLETWKQQLAEHARTLARVVVMACHQGDHAGRDWESLPARLHREGVDAVAACRWAVSQASANTLAHALYTHLARGEPLGLAAARARVALRDATPRTPGGAGALPDSRRLHDALGLQVYQHAPRSAAVFVGPGVAQGPDAAHAAAHRARYAAWLTQVLDELPSVFRVGPGRDGLSSVYVAVQLSAQAGDLAAGEGALYDGARALSAAELQARAELPTRPFPLEHLVDLPHRTWTVLGEPGSGKTTLLNHTALRLLDLRPDRVPVVLKVADLRAAGGSLRAALQAQMGSLRETADWVLSEVQAGRAVVLLDGLDEVEDLEQARRDLAGLAGVGGELGGGVLVVASRPVHYQRPSRDFWTLGVCPLGDKEQAELLRRWLPHEEGRVKYALRTLRGTPRLRELAQNPMLLTLAGIVLSERKGVHLPRSRGELYRRALEVLARRQTQDAEGARRLAQPDAALRLLGRAALRLHDHEPSLVSRAKLRVALEKVANEVTLRPWGGAEGLIEQLATRAGLLVPDAQLARNARAFGFPHRTFREYLAATALAGTVLAGAAVVADWKTVAQVLALGQRNPARWSEVLALACGLLAPGKAELLIRHLAAQPDEASQTLFFRVLADAEGLAPELVQEVLRLKKGRRPEDLGARGVVIQGIPALVKDLGVARRLLEQVAQATCSGDDLYHVREALRALAADEAGDPKERALAGESAEHLLEAHRQEDREWVQERLEELRVRIPAGSFWMGNRVRKRGRDPEHRVDIISDFYLMRVPVTWALFLRFDPEHSAMQQAWPGLPKGECQQPVPVYHVTWYAAVMFAEWLGMRLPMEAEWEYACRGQRELSAPRTQYWSGNSEEDLSRVGWYSDNSSGHPHPVPHPKANPFGLHDMHGNVWEWCLDWYQGDVYEKRRPGVKLDPGGKGGREPTLRVGNDRPQSAERAARGDWRNVRGGSWRDNADGARAAFRNAELPSKSDTNLGFRLAVAVSHEREPGS